MKVFVIVGAIVLFGSIVTATPANIAYGLPAFEEQEEKKYNEVFEKYTPPEHRYLIENLTDGQRRFLGVVIGVGQYTPTEEQIKNIIQDAPEQAPFDKKVNDTETARAALPFVDASSPVRYNIDKLNVTEIPFTAPGQILIYVSVETESTTMFPPDWKSGDPIDPDIQYNETLPNSWSGNIRFDSGSKSVSYAGAGNDEFIMDCTPDTPYGAIFQNDEDDGSLTVMILGSDYTSQGSPETLV